MKDCFGSPWLYNVLFLALSVIDTLFITLKLTLT